MPARPRRVREAGKRTDIDALRFAAETYYTLTPGDISLDAMSRVPQFADVGVGTLQRWANEGGWMARRQHNQDTLRDMLRFRLAHSLVEERVQQMEAQQWICDEGMALLENEMLQPKRGWEGVAGTVVGTMRNMEQMRQGIVSELSAGVSAPAAHAGMATFEDDITPEEAQAAAKALLDVRQKALRASGPAAEGAR